MTNLQLRREIDAIVDDIVEHPERKDELKVALRRKIMAPSFVDASKFRVVGREAAPGSFEVEDLFDNVPV